MQVYTTISVLRISLPWACTSTILTRSDPSSLAFLASLANQTPLHHSPPQTSSKSPLSPLHKQRQLLQRTTRQTKKQLSWPKLRNAIRRIMPKVQLSRVKKKSKQFQCQRIEPHCRKLITLCTWNRRERRLSICSWLRVAGSVRERASWESGYRSRNLSSAT